MKFLGRKSNLYLLLSLLSILFPLRLGAETIQIASGEYPPWTSAKLPGGGYLNLVVKEAFKLHNLKVEFHYMPWKRALEATRVGKYHASSFWGESKEREKDFLHSKSIENIYFVFFYNKKAFNGPLSWHQLSDLNTYKIGAIRGYTYNDEFWQLYHANKLRVALTNDDVENFRKLIAGKIELFPISEFTGKYLLHRNFSPTEIKSIGIGKKPLSEGKNFILFSKVFSENTRYLQALNEGLESLEQQGKLKQLREKNIQMKQLLLLFLILFGLSYPSIASQQAISVDQTSTSIDLTEHILYIEDTEHTLNSESVIQQEDNKWQKLPGGKANFGFSNSAYWFRFAVKNSGSNPLDAYLHINYSQLDNIQLFQLSNKPTLKPEKLFETGDSFPFSERPIEFPTFVLPLELKTSESHEYLVRVSSQGSVQAPMKLWIQESFLEFSNHSLFLYGCFLSALLIMSAYNFCLFLIVRDKAYIIYSIFIFCMAGVHGCLDGYAYQWFWPDAPSWHQISAITFISLGILSTVLFTHAILPIPQQSIFYKLIKLLTVMTVSSAIVSVFLPYRPAAILNAVMTVIVMSSIAITCIAMLKHSPRIARFFCVAWGAYFTGIVLKSSSKIGLLPPSVFTEYAGNIGGVIGIVIISMALADRINSERRAREKAQAQSIDNLKRYEDLYQNALEGIFSYDNKGQLLSANPAFLSLIGLKDIDTFSGNLKELKGHYLPQKEFTDFFRTVKKEGQVVDYETQLSNTQGDTMWVNISARYNKNEEKEELEGTLININERKAFEQQLKHLAEHDSLTGFFNRRTFENSAKELLRKVQANEESACLLYMDLDQFKIVNDLCGHTAGDILLKNISQKLLQEVQALGPHQVIARLGGDEFGILLSGTNLPKSRLIAESLRATVENFLFIWEGKRYSIGVSIGLVEICPFHQNIEQLLAMADAACYMAKDQGRNRVHVFIESDKEMQFRQLEMQWVTTIKEALDKDQFFLVYQNITTNNADPSKAKDKSAHYEILIRLINSNGNLCSPGQFLPAAERYNLMPNIDRWVIRHYFSWLSKHPEHMETLGCASINLSTQSIGHKEFPAFLISIFDEYQVPPHKICFEITESMAITHLDNTQDFIAKFRALGCHFALDDFGTGFSSYAYLKDLNIDYLKIDGIFVKNLCEDNVNTAMIKSIADVASAIGIETIAEFVETEAIQNKLSEIGITYSQGYHIHKPVKLESLAIETLQAMKTNENKGNES